VTNLHKEDFRITDSGKPREISRFSVESRARGVGAAGAAAAPSGLETALGEAPAGAAPDRFVAYLFDDVHLNAGDLILSRQAALRHIATALAPADRAAIFTTSGIGMLDFTDDQALLRQALDRIMPRAKAPTNCDATYYIADQYRNLHDPIADSALAAQARACNPGADARTVPMLKDEMAFRAVAEGERDTRLALSVLGDAVRRLSTMPGQRAIVLASPGFLAREMSLEKNQLMELAVRSHVSIGAVNATGLPAFMPDASQSHTSPVRQQLDRAAAIEEDGVLGELADGTGGIHFHNSNDLEEGFRRAASPPECVYLLGFAPQNLKYDGSFHALKVTLTGSYDVQARRGYYAPKRMTDAEEQATEEIREAVFSREEIRELPLEVRTQFFKPDDASARLTVVVQVDPKPLHFRKADGRNNDILKIVSAVFDRDGKYVAGNAKTLTMRLTDETLATRMNGGLNLRSGFDVTPGLYQVRVVIRDSEGQLMAARNAAIDIP
jgi:VWFA-related protein